jgi:protein-tyrosine phosphatase
MNASDNPLPAFVDLHSHLVPGVDDGSASIDESRSSLAGLYEEGVRTLVTTPHLILPHLESEADIDRELARHRRSFDTLAAALDGESGVPALGLGQEIWASDGAQMRRAAARPDIGLDGSDAMLVEFGFGLRGTHMDVIDAALAEGRRILIAHAERYRYPEGLPAIELMRRWRARGALLQVNAGSFTGHYQSSSPGSLELAWEMVAEGLVDVIATDHHGTRRAGVSPREVYEALRLKNDGALAERAMSVVPASLLLRIPSADG